MIDFQQQSLVGLDDEWSAGHQVPFDEREKTLQCDTDPNPLKKVDPVCNASRERGVRQGRDTGRRTGRAPPIATRARPVRRSEEHTSELQSRRDLVCRLLLEKKKNKRTARRSTHRAALRR